MFKHWKVDPAVRCTSASTESGSTEYIIFIIPPNCPGTQEALVILKDLYQRTLETCNLDSQTLAFSRIYFSDIANQIEEFRKSDLGNTLSSGAMSTIGQKNLDGARVALMIYHVSSQVPAIRAVETDSGDCNSAFISGANYQMLWTANHRSNNHHLEAPEDSYLQTRDVFGCARHMLEEKKMDFLHNMVRTWIYVRDIDNQYARMVTSRKFLFRQEGLDNRSRYIASTGIEGQGYESDTLVQMDTLSFAGLHDSQLGTLKALENLPDTSSYGVTFSRGEKVVFGDRTQYYISGTASIDDKGDILFPGDPGRQTVRILENIQALLEPEGASLSDTFHMIVYLRNDLDTPVVKSVLDQSLAPNVPVLYLQAAVCRPGWLVEIELVAITTNLSNPEGFPDFL